jgi:hypothetical protein
VLLAPTSLGGDEPGIQPPLAGGIKTRSFGTVGDYDGNFRRNATRLNRVGNRQEIGTASRKQDAQFFGLIHLQSTVGLWLLVIVP